MTWPNILSLFRVFLSPIFLIIYVTPNWLGLTETSLPFVLLIFLTLSELSDFTDGYIARKYNQVTDVGKILDPMADSLTHLSVFLAFTQPPVSIPLLLVFVFLYRESVISALRTVCALRGFVLAARPSGKIKAAIQAFAAFAIIFLMIFYHAKWINLDTLQTTSFYLTTLAAIYSLFSAADYMIVNRDYIKKAFA